MNEKKSLTARELFLQLGLTGNSNPIPWFLGRALDAATIHKRSPQEHSQIDGLRERAEQRRFETELRCQANIEELARRARKMLNDDALPVAIDDGWLAALLNACQHESADDIQDLWAAVLAQECCVAGTWPREAIAFLHTLNAMDVCRFAALCSSCWMIAGRIVPILLDVEHPVYQSHGIDEAGLAGLEERGLIMRVQGGHRVRFRSHPITSDEQSLAPTSERISYFGKHLDICFVDADDMEDWSGALDELRVGPAALTQRGERLFSACKPVVRPELFAHVKERLATVVRTCDGVRGLYNYY